MAGIFERVKDILDQNINGILDKAEDPEKAADQLVRQYKTAMKELNASSSKVIAEESLAKSKLNDCDNEIEKYTKYAKRAIQDGNDEMARTALQRKKEHEATREVLNANYQKAKAQADRARNDYKKLANGVSAIEARAAQIKSNAVAAKATKMSAGVNTSASVDGVMDKLTRAEEKSKRMLAEAEASAELSGVNNLDSELEAMYGDASVSDVDDELEAMKKEMGLGEVEASSTDDELSQLKAEMGL